MKTAELIKNKIKNSKIAVLGCGVSNIPLIELLIECGNEIIVHDKSPFENLDERARAFAHQGVKFVCGEHYLDEICADIIFRSPGIRPDFDGIKKAVQNGAILTSEMELFLELTPAKVLGITGSDGKTTTTTITYELLKKQFENTDINVYVGGNIGTPLLSKVGEMTENDLVVLELSSFQLFTITKSPARAVLTNLSPNHLDWHRGMEEYIDAKTNIFKFGAEHLTTNGNNDICTSLLEKNDISSTVFSAHLSLDELLKKNPNAKSAFFIENNVICFYDQNEKRKILDIDDILVPGLHNIENYMAAISLTLGIVSVENIISVAKEFCGVEHRLEFVRELDGVKYYNSSIDSSPTRTDAALSALKTKPIVICGGYDKNIPFEPLAISLCQKAKAVVLTGATAEKINHSIENCELFKNSTLSVHLEGDFEKAIILAKNLAKEGDIVLLSPACASFDAFKNFMERGNKFKNIVKGL